MTNSERVCREEGWIPAEEILGYRESLMVAALRVSNQQAYDELVETLKQLDLFFNAELGEFFNAKSWVHVAENYDYNPISKLNWELPTTRDFAWVRDALRSIRALWVSAKLSCPEDYRLFQPARSEVSGRPIGKVSGEGAQCTRAVRFDMHHFVCQDDTFKATMVLMNLLVGSQGLKYEWDEANRLFYILP